MGNSRAASKIVTFGTLANHLNRRGGHAHLSELTALHKRAEDILRANRIHVVEYDGRMMVGSSAPGRQSPLYDVAWLSQGETEVLVVAGLMGDMTAAELRLAFVRSGRPFPDDVIEQLVRHQYLEPPRAGGALSLAGRGRSALAAMDQSELDRIAKPYRKHAEIRLPPEIRQRIEAMLTACMGSLRPKFQRGTSDPAALDAALIVEVACNDGLRRSEGLLRRLGVSTSEYDASVARLHACGLLWRNDPDHLALEEPRDLLSDVTPAEAAAWFAARTLGRFRTQEANRLWLMAGQLEGAAAYPFLAEMVSRGHLAQEWPGRQRITPAGNAFVAHFETLVDGLHADHPLRAVRDRVNFAKTEWTKRVYEDGGLPRFLAMFPPEAAGEGAAVFPPLPGDVRIFAITKSVGGARTEADSLTAQAFDALACGPMDAASLAGCLGIGEAAACRLLCRLAAKGLVKDSSQGARERSASWAAFCEAVAAATAAGETNLEGADADEFACALTYLRDAGDSRIPDSLRPLYPAEPKGRLSAYPSLKREPQRGTTRAKVLDAIRQRPSTIADLMNVADVTSARLRQIVDKLSAAGLVRIWTLNPATFVSDEYAPREVQMDCPERSNPAPGMC